MEPHPPFTFMLSNRPAVERCAVIGAGLTADNSRLIGAHALGAPGKDWEPLHLFLLDDAGQVVGGVSARLLPHWGWLHISTQNHTAP